MKQAAAKKSVLEFHFVECLQFSCLLLIMICANGGKVGGKRSTVFHERIHLRGMTEIVLMFVFFKLCFFYFSIKKTNELSLKSRRVRYFCLYRHTHRERLAAI